MANRKQQIASNIKAPHRANGGGVAAPPSAAKGPTTGLGANMPAPMTYGLGQAKPAQGLSAAPQPGAAAPAQPQPTMPWDAAAANDEAGALRRRNDTLTGLDSGWLREQQEYGLEGPWADYASNPYSRASLLQRSYDNAKKGTLNTAGQQLYAGSYVNAQNSNTHGFNLGRDELQKGYAQEGAQYISSRQQADNEYQEALSQAAWNRVNAGLAAEPESAPTAGGDSGGGGNGGGGAPTAKKKQQPRKQQIKQNISNARKAR